MTLQEFKAWFDGFTEEMSGAPNKKQWERIKKRVKEIDGTAVTYPVFVDGYWRPSYPYWSVFNTGGTIAQAQGLAQTVGYNGPITSSSATMNVKDDGHAVFNSSSAMLALGKADYQSIGG